MLVKFPGLTLVGGLAMAFAICAGAVTFVLVGQFLNPTLPLPDGDRIVRIRNWDTSANDVEARSLGDFSPGAARRVRSPAWAPTATSPST
jgi:hypothetical protein